jgi:hypothetical protein
MTASGILIIFQKFQIHSKVNEPFQGGNVGTDKSQRGLVISQIFAGIGIGLLVGIIVGLSVSPVVKTILGTLAGLLAAFLGLQDSFFAKQKEQDTAKVESRMKMSAIRSASFGLTCVVGILLGIVLRTHEVLTITVKEHVGTWVEAGYDSVTARNYVAYQRLRILPDSASFRVDTTFAKSRIDASSGFLFSKKAMKNYAVTMNPNKYKGNVEKTLKAYDFISDEVSAYAANVKKVPEEHRARIIESVHAVFEELGNSENELDDICKSLKIETTEENIDQRLQSLTQSKSEKISILAQNISDYIESDQDKTSLLKSIAEVICTEK